MVKIFAMIRNVITYWIDLEKRAFKKIKGYDFERVSALLIVLPVIIFLLFLLVDSGARKKTSQLMAKSGLYLDNIYISKTHYSDRDRIVSYLQQIDVKIGTSIFKVDLKEMAQKLETLPWVKQVSVTRKFPSEIIIKIHEYKPVAIWQNDFGEEFLVDQDGFVITEYYANHNYKLPHLIKVTGDGSKEEIKDLMVFLTKKEDIYENISLASRVGNRRWDITFVNGVNIKLPEDNPEKSWLLFAKLNEKDNLINRIDIRNIDLRIANKLFIEKKSNFVNISLGETK